MQNKQKILNACACYTMSFYKLQYCVGLWTDLLESVSDGETLNRIYGFNN